MLNPLPSPRIAATGHPCIGAGHRARESNRHALWDMPLGICPSVIYLPSSKEGHTLAMSRRSIG